MNGISGTYAISTTLGESVRSFIPHPLPPADPPLAPSTYADLNHQAEMALARLSGVSGLVPSVGWLLYSAFRLVRDNLRDPTGLPISVGLLCDAHRALLAGVRGAGKQPGELRRSQNWIDGTRPGNATFVPPPADRVAGLLGDLEQFIHHEESTLPPLVRIALAHAQFETIHPFLDGNGRIGRLLIAALVEHWGLLAEPLMYLSGYLKRHQGEYYRRIDSVCSPRLKQAPPATGCLSCCR